jgi:hypothetical protein
MLNAKLIAFGKEIFCTCGAGPRHPKQKKKIHLAEWLNQDLQNLYS